MVQRVCLVSGGTGGHLMPALVLARAMRSCGHQPMLVTEGRAVERELVARELPDLPALSLPASAGSKLTLPMWVLRATVAARRLLRERAVDCVVSTGGRPSVPMGIAARSLGLPLFLLEQNAVVGRANRMLGFVAQRIYHGLPPAERTGARALVTGTPLRPGLGRIARATAREQLDLPVGATVVLVTGGSQGARALNETVPAALLRTGRELHVLHLSGLGHDATVRAAYGQAGGRVKASVRPVAADMDRLFAAADLVVCRGGGTTVAELCAVGRPAVIVPYPHHRDQQQLRNAEVLVHAGAALVVEERELTVEGLANLLDALLVDPVRLQAMGAAARRLCGGDAAATILQDMGLQGAPVGGVGNGGGS